MHSIASYLNNDIIYQINLRAFTNEGTLNAAAKLLPHIKDIGADIVYLCPCFVADSDTDKNGWSARQHKSGLENPQNPYRISDYFNVDPEYGTNDDLRAFVDAAHKIGLRVILDLVYFHCGPKAVFLYEHPEFILRDEFGDPLLGEWCFPRLNYESRELREYLIANMELFVRDYDIDGYRCDVGDSVPLDFWAEARERIDQLKPDLMMLNEGIKADYLDVFDLNYSWNLRAAFVNCVENGKSVQSFVENMTNFVNNHLQGSYHSINLLENHDSVNDDYENRLEKRIGFAAMNAGLVLQYTLPNVPFLYNGLEVADTNRHSIWGNRTHSANLVIDWQNALTNDGTARLKLVKTLSALRHTCEPIGMNGNLEFASTSSDNVLAYKRTLDGKSIAIIVNLSPDTINVKSEIEAYDISPLLINNSAISLSGCDGKFSAHLSAYGFAIAEII
ncbi:MAG: hypothetical protein HFE63_08885 [Clostridiales bacterium]|nr:hypothetical protein [Clostridiales bacterium]